MDIILSNTSGKPIYTQIADQVKEQIMTGALAPGEALPSIRSLARDLRVSVITTKRAYEELERAGYVVTVAGKGSFVAERDLELEQEARLREIESHLSAAAALGKKCGVTESELAEMLRLQWEE